MRLTRPLAEGSERVQLRLIDTAFNEALVDLDLVTAAIDGPSGGSVSRKVKMVFGSGGVGSSLEPCTCLSFSFLDDVCSCILWPKKVRIFVLF